MLLGPGITVVLVELSWPCAEQRGAGGAGSSAQLTCKCEGNSTGCSRENTDHGGKPVKHKICILVQWCLRRSVVQTWCVSICC